jgi:hypothetical protein
MRIIAFLSENWCGKGKAPKTLKTLSTMKDFKGPKNLKHLKDLKPQLILFLNRHEGNSPQH